MKQLLNYQIFGKDNSQILLFIHALGGSGEDWRAQINYFSKKHKVITVDLRNFGASFKSDEVNIKILAQDVLFLLDALKINKVNIIGLSLGGMIALQIAVLKPEILQSLTIVNAIDRFVLLNFREKFLYYLHLYLPKILGMKVLMWFLANLMFPGKKNNNLRQDFIEKFKKNDKKSYLLTVKNLRNWDISNDLYKISCKTLIIASANDYIALWRKQEMVARIQNAQIKIIANAHHGVSYEMPDKFNLVLDEFLK